MQLHFSKELKFAMITEKYDLSLLKKDWNIYFVDKSGSIQVILRLNAFLS